MRNELTNKEKYLNQLFELNDPVLSKIENKLKEDDRWGINIGAHEVSVLNYIIKSNNIKNILEIGTLYAYSTYAMASSIPSNGTITSLEKNESTHNIAKSLIAGSSLESKIKLINCDAKAYLQDHQENYDLIFIDANKSGYMGYLELSLKLLSPGGTIVGDNTFLFGNVYGEGSSSMSDKNIEVMKSFNKKLIGNKDFAVTMLPSKEGMTLIKKIN